MGPGNASNIRSFPIDTGVKPCFQRLLVFTLHAIPLEVDSNEVLRVNDHPQTGFWGDDKMMFVGEARAHMAEGLTDPPVDEDPTCCDDLLFDLFYRNGGHGIFCD